MWVSSVLPMRFIYLVLGVLLALASPVAYAQNTELPGAFEDFSESNLIIASAKYLGATAESMAEIIDSMFSRYGAPSAIIRGEEVSIAAMLGVRYGRGVLAFPDGRESPIFWRGPSAGVDTGGNGSKSFTLVYGIENKEDLYKRFGGVDGSLYYLGGVAVSYLQRGGVVLAPMRAGVGFRFGVSMGYLKFSPKNGWIPF